MWCIQPFKSVLDQRLLLPQQYRVSVPRSDCLVVSITFVDEHRLFVGESILYGGEYRLFDGEHRLFDGEHRFFDGE